MKFLQFVCSSALLVSAFSCGAPETTAAPANNLPTANAAPATTIATDMNSQTLDLPDAAQKGGYLFATFKGESTPMTEQIYFAFSENGRDWSALNEGNPTLVSQVGEKGVRDPYLVRSPDGSKTWLIATDLSINLNHDWGRAVTRGSRSIVIWETSDLKHWTGPRLVEVAAPDAGSTWAPEAVWDAERKEYLVFWASKNKSDNFAKHRIWAAWTPDFRTFGEPFVWIDKPQAVIDTDVVRENGRYYRFSKDEENKVITLESSDELLGQWQDVPNFSLANLKGVEGPLCFRLNDGQWCLLLDQYGTGQGYKAFLSNDLSKGQFTPAADFSYPFRFRHGSIIALSPATESQQ